MFGDAGQGLEKKVKHYIYLMECEYYVYLVHKGEDADAKIA